MNVQQFLAIGAVMLMTMPTPVWSAAAAIGTAAGRGNFELNKKTVAGNGTVRAGDQIATAGGGSTLRLEDGTRVDLSPRSAGEVHRDRLILASGTAAVRPQTGFGVEAASLTIRPEAGNSSLTSRATVTYLDGNRVQVSADGGNYQVKNRQGVLVARVMPGRALVLAPQAGVNSRMILSGVLETSRGRFFLTDQTAAVKFQLSGADLDRFSGKQVSVTGSLMEGVAGTDGAAQVVAVHLVELAMQIEGAAAAASSSGAGGAGAGAGAGAAGAGAGGAAGAGAAGAGAAGAGAGAAGAAAGGLAGMSTGVLAGVGVAAAAATGIAVKQVVADDDSSISK